MSTDSAGVHGHRRVGEPAWRNPVANQAIDGFGPQTRVVSVTERIWLFSWSSFGRRLRVSLAPGGLGVGEGVEHELAPGERRVDREVCVAGPETDACGCRTVSGAQPAIAQLGESVGDG